LVIFNLKMVALVEVEQNRVHDKDANKTKAKFTFKKEAEYDMNNLDESIVKAK